MCWELHRALQAGYLHEHFRGLLCVTCLCKGTFLPSRWPSSCEEAKESLWGGQVSWEQHNPSAIGKLERHVVSKEGCLKGGPGRRGIVHWEERGDSTVRVEILPQFADKCPGMGLYIMMSKQSLCPTKTSCCFYFFFLPVRKAGRLSNGSDSGNLEWWIGVTADTWQVFI